MEALLQVILPANLWCPWCGARHVDVPDDAQAENAHRAHDVHQCRNCCRRFRVTVVGIGSVTQQRNGAAAPAAMGAAE